MTKERNIAVSIILSILTCGIYAIYWFIVITDEAREVSGDESAPSGGIAFLLTLVTCGIYGIYWAYKIGKSMSIAKEKNGMPADDNAVLYLILELIGFNIIVSALVQNDLNLIARKEVTTK